MWSNYLQYHNVTLAPRDAARRARRRSARTSPDTADVLQRVRDLRRPPFPPRRCAGRAGRVPRAVDLPTLGGARADQDRLGEHRLVRARDARALPLARRPRRADREPAAVDLQARLGGPLLPALAAAGASDAARHQALPARRLDAPTPTAARPRRRRRLEPLCPIKPAAVPRVRAVRALAGPPRATTPSCAPTSGPTRSCCGRRRRSGRRDGWIARHRGRDARADASPGQRHRARQRSRTACTASSSGSAAASRAASRSRSTVTRSARSPNELDPTGAYDAGGHAADTRARRPHDQRHLSAGRHRARRRRQRALHGPLGDRPGAAALPGEAPGRMLTVSAARTPTRCAAGRSTGSRSSSR